jgi:hypothetical protein
MLNNHRAGPPKAPHDALGDTAWLGNAERWPRHCLTLPALLMAGKQRLVATLAVVDDSLAKLFAKSRRQSLDLAFYTLTNPRASYQPSLVNFTAC